MSFSSSQWVWAQDKVEYLQNFPVPTAQKGTKTFLEEHYYFYAIVFSQDFFGKQEY